MKKMALLTLFGLMLQAGILQDAINKAKPGSRLDLPKGVYKGPIVIDKPLMLVGHDTVIDGGGEGTVVSIRSSNVILKKLTIRNSGNEHEKIDAGISVKDASFVQIDHCKIVNCLFGIDLQNVKNSEIIHNYITSKPFPLGIRGDGIRLWYSNDNVLKENHLYKSRDFVVWYSHGNKIVHNKGEYGRYSLHFMYAGRNFVENNIFKHNSVGIFFMYSKDTIAKNNIIMSSLGTTGIGIGLKDASNFTLQNNTILYCAKGLYIDRSPFEPGQINKIVGNEILYNSIGIHFHSLSTDNLITKNVFKGNMENVYDDSGQGRIHAVMNKWYENYWDDYQGFDQDGDGIGDVPYTLYYYADKLWLLNPNIRFFYGSPVISILNFLYKLAPFSEPIQLLTDPKPLMHEEGVS